MLKKRDGNLKKKRRARFNHFVLQKREETFVFEQKPVQHDEKHANQQQNQIAFSLGLVPDGQQDQQPTTRRTLFDKRATAQMTIVQYTKLACMTSRTRYT